MNRTKTIKQFIIILMLGTAAGLIANAVNPSGIPLVMDASRYSTDKSDSIKNSFMNNPYDTSQKQTPALQNPNVTKDGIVKPQNIKIDLAKFFFDKNALFFDGRKPEEFAAGHIKNAVSLPYEEFSKKTKEEKTELMRKYNKEGMVVVYCGGGKCEVSIDLAYELARVGFTSLNIYLGGYKEWEDTGYPIEK